MSFESEGLRFSPVVPKGFGGVTVLENFKYRAASLSISVEGFGSTVSSATMDGQPLAPVVIPPGTQGNHVLKIIMANDGFERSPLRIADAAVAPKSPVLEQDAAIVHWASVPGALSYIVVMNGERVKEEKGTSFTLPVAESYAEYQVSAVDKNGTHSFLSEPIVVAEHGREMVVQPEGGKSPVDLTRLLNRKVTFRVTLKQPGTYSIDFRYANGSGPINTDNKCAIRTLTVDNKASSAIVFPQRGMNEWSNWGYSSRQQVNLAPGAHELSLTFEPYDENMNGEVNRALLDSLRLTRIYEVK
jgi:hypothetical protein